MEVPISKTLSVRPSRKLLRKALDAMMMPAKGHRSILPRLFSFTPHTFVWRISYKRNIGQFSNEHRSILNNVAAKYATRTLLTRIRLTLALLHDFLPQTRYAVIYLQWNKRLSNFTRGRHVHLLDVLRRKCASSLGLGPRSGVGCIDLGAHDSYLSATRRSLSFF
jgi:hypothetical protein